MPSLSRRVVRLSVLCSFLVAVATLTLRGAWLWEILTDFSVGIPTNMDAVLVELGSWGAWLLILDWTLAQAVMSLLSTGGAVIAEGAVMLVQPFWAAGLGLIQDGGLALSGVEPARSLALARLISKALVLVTAFFIIPTVVKALDRALRMSKVIPSLIRNLLSKRIGRYLVESFAYIVLSFSAVRVFG